MSRCFCWIKMYLVQILIMIGANDCISFLSIVRCKLESLLEVCEVCFKTSYTRFGQLLSQRCGLNT